MTHDLILGLILGPLVWFLIAKIVWTITKQHKAISTWYRGLPLIQYPALFLVILGMKVIKQKNCKVLFYNDGEGKRIWLSPNTEGFKIAD